jgi:hypothetical protein
MRSCSPLKQSEERKKYSKGFPSLWETKTQISAKAIIKK